MLKNIATRAVNLRWNGQDFLLTPGKTFEMSGFGITDPKLVSQLEQRFVAKHKGSVEIVNVEANVSDIKTKDDEKKNDAPPAEPVEQTEEEKAAAEQALAELIESIDGMDRDQLIDLIEAKQLDKKLLDIKKVRELRIEVKAALAPKKD